jgi:hypothetical protein
MKNKVQRPLVLNRPSEDDVRAYAFHLYEQSNCAPGRDLENWWEAIACLNANIPAHRSHCRLYHHLNQAATAGVPAVPLSLDS